jgi:hypothetical protein
LSNLAGDLPQNDEELLKVDLGTSVAELGEN